MKEKTLEDFQPQYSCRFHPTDSWHEIGCRHQEWTVEQLQQALDNAKQALAFAFYRERLAAQHQEKQLEDDRNAHN